MADPFDPQRARSKRPFPVWVDALLRDTQTFEADEFGAYLRLLLMMWTSQDCSIPNDPRRLARAAGVSVKLWKGRIGNLIVPLLCETATGLSQPRLLKEAEQVEAFCLSQHRRRHGSADTLPEKSHTLPTFGETESAPQQRAINSDKSLKTNEPPLSTDETGDTTGEQTGDTTYLQPITYREGKSSSSIPPPPALYDSARDDEPAMDASSSSHKRIALLEAIGLDETGLTGRGGKQLGTRADMEIAWRWGADLGLSLEDQCAVIRECMATKTEPGPPTTFRYFNQAMTRLSGARAENPLTPAAAQPRRTKADESLAAAFRAAERFDSEREMGRRQDRDPARALSTSGSPLRIVGGGDA